MTEDEIRGIMDSEEKAEAADLTPEGHTLVVEKLNQVIDKIGILTLTMSMSSKKPKFEPVPRPVTETRRKLNERIAEITERDQKDFSKSIGF
ncbi:MAG: hypothetical protein PHW63_09655 [Alphaproteobacteria bacterium]|nr:hypothetical protein [Alphaproteobacteria bacterium]